MVFSRRHIILFLLLNDTIPALQMQNLLNPSTTPHIAREHDFLL
jgi:hypothetical protein